MAYSVNHEEALVRAFIPAQRQERFLEIIAKGISEQPSILRWPGIPWAAPAMNNPVFSVTSLRNPPFTRRSETLRPCHCQPFAVQIQVHQREAGTQPMMVLLNPAVSHFFETKNALQNPERMFYLRSHSSLHPVLGLL